MTSLLILVLQVVLMPLDGIVIAQLWQWFVVPLGAAHIGIAQGIGLNLLVCVLRPVHFPSTDSEREQVMRVLLCSLGNLVALGFGAVMHAFM